MGEVYAVEDIRLKRRVALKILPAHLTGEEERLRRFELEARAASALNHPNILTVFEIGQSGSVHFIATELIEGHTLRQRLSSGAMTTGEALDVGAQVADALDAAHARGIIHRDIKPANIMLRPDGYVKVLDFGIAKLTEQIAAKEGIDLDGTTHLLVTTEPGMVIGTPNYMSPEQVRGTNLDTRSDIFSLGVVLYEMIAGSSPFNGQTISDVLAAVLEREPLPLAHHVPSLDARLQSLVSRAVHKNKDERFASAKDLATELRELRRRLDLEAELGPSYPPDEIIDPLNLSGSEPSEKRRIENPEVRASEMSGTRSYSRKPQNPKIMDALVVLPFVNASGDSNMDYLSDGITETIINSLSQLPGLRVVPRSTVFRYKGREVDPREVGQTLGARAVLMGRVLQMGGRLIIATELVDIANDSQLWGERYNRQVSDVFEVQEEIAKEIADKLRIKLTDQQKKRLTRRHAENTESYQLYLKGLYHWNKRTPEGLKKGIEHFNQAIGVDPSYALAYAGLAHCYALMPGYTGVSTMEAHPKAKAAAVRALEIDEELAEAYLPLATVKLYYDWDWPGAGREYERAIDLNANYASAVHAYAVYLVLMARLDEAFQEYKLAQRLDPLSLPISSSLGWALYIARRTDEAIEQCLRTLEMDPSFARAHLYLGELFVQARMFEQSIASFEKAYELSGEGLALFGLGHAYAVSGITVGAHNVLEKLDQSPKPTDVSPYHTAVIYTGLGEKDRAVDLLEKAYNERSYWIPFVKTEPRFDSLHSEPGFEDLLRRIGLS